jgi:hypothetical protein
MSYASDKAFVRGLKKLSDAEVWHLLNLTWRESYRRASKGSKAIGMNTSNPQEKKQGAGQEARNLLTSVGTGR